MGSESDDGDKELCVVCQSDERPDGAEGTDGGDGFAGRGGRLVCDLSEPCPEADFDPPLLMVIGGECGRSALMSSGSSSTTALRCSFCRRRRMLMFQLLFRPSPAAPVLVPLAMLTPVCCATRLSAAEPKDGGGGPPELEERARHAAIMLRTLDTGDVAGFEPDAALGDTVRTSGACAAGEAATGIVGKALPIAEFDDAERLPPIALYGDDLDNFFVGVGGGTYLSGPRSSCSGGGRALRTCQLARGPSSIEGGLSTLPTLRPRPRVLGVALGTRVGVERPGEKPGEAAPAARATAGETAPLGDAAPAVRKLLPVVFMPAKTLPPTGAGRVGETELVESDSNIFIRFDTRALLGVFVGEERLGAGALRADPVRLVGVVRRVGNGDLLGDLLGTDGASEEAREYSEGAAGEGFIGECADRAVWKLPATLETERGEARPPTPRFGGAGDTGEFTVGLIAGLLWGDGGSGKLRATVAADTLADVDMPKSELSPTVPVPRRMPSPCPPSPAGVVG